MSRRFNTTGPCIVGQHYLLDPLARLDLPEVEDLIEQGKYFVLHAPRQTGKTTTLLALTKRLNAAGRYASLYVNVEIAQTAGHDVARALDTIVTALASAAQHQLGDRRLHDWRDELREKHIPGDSWLITLLERWAGATEKPLVLLIDEIDALVGNALVSVLRQLRSGYISRGITSFPHSVILCGIRDVRDYRIHTTQEGIITGGSCFNIKAKSLGLGNFTAAETQALWQQHTDDTGQAFEPDIFASLWEDSHGQPWLVNALGNECAWEDKTARDRSQPISLEQYREARERLIQSRATHLEQLTDKLREERVRRVIATLLAGESSGEHIPADDRQYVEDLGLIRSRPQLAIANRIYQEVIPRELTWTAQSTIAQPTPWYLRPDHSLDIPKLLAAFQQFFRENSEIWLERFEYKEAGPQLLMQAFLQRIINGGGRLNREYGLGLKRTDLFIEWPLLMLPSPTQTESVYSKSREEGSIPDWHGPIQRIVIELKILRKSLDATIVEGLEQTADYATRSNAAEAHLVIFNRNPQISWDDKIWQRQEDYDGRGIGVWGA